MLDYKYNNISIKEYNELYDSVGWGSYNPNISEIALKNTLYSVSLYLDNKIIGYGRLIGDGACFIYIQDIMIKKEYQHKHYGTLIMEKILLEINNYKKLNPDIRVYLGAMKDKEDFYRKFGFVTREEKGLGPGMILNK